MYDEDPKTKKRKLIKKNIIIRHNLNINDISSPSQIVDTKGNIIKKKCKILVKDVGTMIINHTYESISELLGNKGKSRQQIGYINDERKFSNKKF